MSRFFARDVSGRPIGHLVGEPGSPARAFAAFQYGIPDSETDL